jgi:AcrR family transcriptional regulator
MNDHATQAPRTRSRIDPQERQAEILHEAIRIIGERGYYGFAVQDLAKRCGLTTGGLLYHFNSKEGLLLAVLREYERRVMAALYGLADRLREQKTGNAPYPLSAVLTFLRASMENSASEPELLRFFAVLQAEAMDHNHPAFGFFREIETRDMERMVSLLTAHCADPVSAARQVCALIDGLQNLWLRSDLGFDLLAEWDRVIVKILPDTKTLGEA